MLSPICPARRPLCWFVVLCAVAALMLPVAYGAAVLTNAAWHDRKILRAWSERVEDADRYVDAGVVLRTVVADPAGTELLDGKPKLRVIRERRFGGIIDTKSNPPCIIGPSSAPVVWHASEEQAAAILHDDPDQLGQLIYGSEGAGKTRLLAMWHYRRWIEAIGEGREGGQTAPTLTRLAMVRQEMLDIFPRTWFSYSTSLSLFTMCDGTRIQLVSTYRQSKAQGSPIQGFNWSWCGRDEAQDQIDVHEDIESRGRAAKDGRYRQLATATAKDDPHWRTLRDMLVASGVWLRRELSIFRSPFVTAKFLSSKSGSMSKREFARRYGDPTTGRIDDLPPELAVYQSWSRSTNLIVIPDIGWTDVTERELRGSGPNNAMLVGHDPGTTIDVSLFLRAYIKAGQESHYYAGKIRPFWVVLGELNTEHSTTEHHISKLLVKVRGEPWMLNLLANNGAANPHARQILVRADPAGNTDQRTDKSVYTQFSNAGIRIKPAAYNSTNDGHGRVPREPGIELVNTLFCADSGERRLFIAANPNGAPAAPRLVEAIESSERDTDGKAETQRKGKGDVSHWPAALRYALWAIERPRLQSIPTEHQT